MMFLRDFTRWFSISLFFFLPLLKLKLIFSANLLCFNLDILVSLVHKVSGYNTDLEINLPVMWMSIQQAYTRRHKDNHLSSPSRFSRLFIFCNNKFESRTNWSAIHISPVLESNLASECLQRRRVHGSLLHLNSSFLTLHSLGHVGLHKLNR